MSSLDGGWNGWKQIIDRCPPGLLVLLEVGLLFIPSIPAYMKVWPKVTAANEWIIQSLVYVYLLVGIIYIGRRHWSWDQLGFNMQGFGLILACGLALIAGRILTIFSVDWELTPPPFNPLQILRDFVFYFGLVAVTEELVFRGVVYRALKDWMGIKWAIWGSSIGFMLWHIFGQGLLIGIASLLYGLIFALARWRSGGIVGLIVVHGLIDFTTVQVLASIDVSGLEQQTTVRPAWMLLGLALIGLVPIYLWKIHPFIRRVFRRSLV